MPYSQQHRADCNDLLKRTKLYKFIYNFLLLQAAVWLSGKHVGLNQQSCAILGPVSTRMGYLLRVGK